MSTFTHAHYCEACQGYSPCTDYRPLSQWDPVCLLPDPCVACGTSLAGVAPVPVPAPVCPCGNRAESEGLCSWCLPHVDCVAPEGVRLYLSRWTGEPRWECDGCGLVWAGLDCVCEASHDCARVSILA